MASMMRSAGGGVGGNQMMDLIKANMMMNSKESPIWTFFIMTFLEFIMKYVSILMAMLQKYMERWFDEKFRKKIENLPIARGANGQDPNEIIFVRHYGSKAKPDAFVTVDAVLMQILKVEEIKKMVYSNATYMINYKEVVKVNNEVKFQLIGSEFGEDGEVASLRFRLFTDNADIQELKRYVTQCERDYEIVKKNKLGNDLFFFDHILPPSGEDGGPGGGPQFFQNQVVFTRNLFLTNRNLGNVFFEQKKEVSTRLDIFLNHKNWYDKRGIPHTLGFLLHGAPGTGKTSSIKAVANMTKRHIINVNLGKIAKKSHLKQLFYDEKIWVLEKGEMGEKLESYIIPINKRLYVMEDIDATDQSVLFKRNLKEIKKLEGKFARGEMEKLFGGKARMNKIIHKEDSDEVNELVDNINNIKDLMEEFDNSDGVVKIQVSTVSQMMSLRNELDVLRQGKHCPAWLDVCSIWINRCNRYGEQLKAIHEKWKSEQEEKGRLAQEETDKKSREERESQDAARMMIEAELLEAESSTRSNSKVDDMVNNSVDVNDSEDVLNNWQELGSREELANYLEPFIDSSVPISFVGDLEKKGVNVLKLNCMFQEYQLINPNSIYYNQLMKMTKYNYIGEDQWDRWIQHLDRLMQDTRLTALYAVFEKMKNMFEKCVERNNELKKTYLFGPVSNEGVDVVDYVLEGEEDVVEEIVAEEKGVSNLGEDLMAVGTAGLLANLEGQMAGHEIDEDVESMNGWSGELDLGLDLLDEEDDESDEEESNNPNRYRNDWVMKVRDDLIKKRETHKEDDQIMYENGGSGGQGLGAFKRITDQDVEKAIKESGLTQSDMNSGLDVGGALYADVTGKVNGQVAVDETVSQQIKLANGEESGDPFSEVMGMMMMPMGGGGGLSVRSRGQDDFENDAPPVDGNSGVGGGWHPHGSLTGGQSGGNRGGSGGRSGFGGGNGGGTSGGGTSGGGGGGGKGKDDEEGGDVSESVDLSCILNILDGTLETPGRIIMISSNYPEKLDHALIRPGRIDLILEFKKANHSVLAEMYECFFEEKADLAEIGRIDEYKWSPAEVSQIMFKNYANPRGAIEDLATQDPKEYFKFSHFHRDTSSDDVAV